MGARFPFQVTKVIVASVPATGADTIIATTPPLTLPFDGAAVLILWFANITVGLGTASYVQKLLRGTVVNTNVLNVVSSCQVTAGNTVLLSGMYVDANPGASTPVYSLSFLGTGTTGIWTTQDVCIAAFAL